MAVSHDINSLQWTGNVQQRTGDHVHRCIFIIGCPPMLGHHLEQDPHVVEREEWHYR